MNDGHTQLTLCCDTIENPPSPFSLMTVPLPFFVMVFMSLHNNRIIAYIQMCEFRAVVNALLLLLLLAVVVLVLCAVHILLVAKVSHRDRNN